MGAVVPPPAAAKKSKSNTAANNRTNNKPSNNDGAQDWKCIKCHHVNENSPKRCKACEAWKGGERLDIRRSPGGNTNSRRGGGGVLLVKRRSSTKSVDDNAESMGRGKRIHRRGGERSNGRSPKSPPDGDKTKKSSPDNSHNETAPSATPQYEEDTKTENWTCTKCRSEVLPHKKRCGNCQSWKGGSREKSITVPRWKKKQRQQQQQQGGSRNRCIPLKVTKKDDKAKMKNCGGGGDGSTQSRVLKVKTTISPPVNSKENQKSTGEQPLLETANSNKTVAIMQDDECNLDDVACCLCKCAVDFGDEFFFMPEGNHVDIGSIDVEQKPVTISDSMTIGEKLPSPCQSAAMKVNVDREDCNASSAIVSSDCSVAGGASTSEEQQFEERKPCASPKTVIHPKEEDNADMADMILSEELMSNSTSAKGCTPLNGVKTTDTEMEEQKIDFIDERKPSPLPSQKPSTSDEDNASEDSRPPFQLPRQFYNPGNSLILCDGPEYAPRSKKNQPYKCDRAYHQLCHFIPVFNVPRGAWRCLVCRYRDDEYLKRRGSKNKREKRSSGGEDSKMAPYLSEDELGAIFRIDREGTQSSDIAAAEQLFEVLSAPLKAKLLNAELTNRAKSLINTSLSTIRTAEHSIRAFTETSKARKVLMERIESMGLPQELIQCFTRIAQSKMRIKDLIRGVESSIKTRQHQDLLVLWEEGIDPVSDLMRWYTNENDKIAEDYLFPEGARTFPRRRVEPRTDEANEVDDASNSSGVSLDNLRCACCLKGHASDDNDLLMCDGVGCFRAFHMVRHILFAAI